MATKKKWIAAKSKVVIAKPKIVAAKPKPIAPPKEMPKLPETLEIIGYRDGEPIYHPVR